MIIGTATLNLTDNTHTWCNHYNEHINFGKAVGRFSKETLPCKFDRCIFTVESYIPKVDIVSVSSESNMATILFGGRLYWIPFTYLENVEFIDD